MKFRILGGDNKLIQQLNSVKEIMYWIWYYDLYKALVKWPIEVQPFSYKDRALRIWLLPWITMN